LAPARHFLLLPLIYLGFISLGLPDGTFGVAWPQMHAELGLPIGLGGTIVLVGTLLAGVSGFASGRIIARFHTGPVVLASCVLTGIALLVISHAQNLTWLIIAAAPLGFGAGAVDAGLNGFVARHYSGRHMNWLHACWGIGATSGPLILAHTLASGSGWRGGYLAIGVAQLCLAVLFLTTLRLWTAQPELKSDHLAKTPTPRVPTTPANSPAGWLSAVMFLVYAATEISAGVWAGSILVISRDVPKETAGLCVAAFFGAITVGRVAVGFVAERYTNRTLITTGILLGLAGAFLFALAPSTWVAALALVLLGAGFSPIYPSLMHEAPRRFAPEAVAVVIGRQTGAAYIGAATFPPVLGVLAQFSLESITWFVVAGTLAMLAVNHRLNRLT
jgi:MFS family permease